MTPSRSDPRLPLRAGAVVIVTMLSIFGVSGERHDGIARTLATPAAAHVAPAAPAAARPPASAAPPPAPPGDDGRTSVDPPAAISSPGSPSMPRAVSQDEREPVGRPNPFAPIIPATPPAPRALRQPMTTGAGTGVPSFGLDLPLPPGFIAPGTQAAPPASPGAGMAVGAIMGGTERVAIVRASGGVFIVAAGDTVDGATVLAIKDDGVTMRRGGVTFELPFGGGGP
jgi:hypothetical protein